MSRSANVLSLQTLKDFKLVMCNFAEEARNSLSGVDMELRRMRDWLERDQLGYWQSQVKKRSEELMQARADLHRRKISQQGARPSRTPSRKRRFARPQRRLRVAEEKVVLVKRLIPQLHHAIDEYHSHSQPLGDHLAGGFEKSLFGLGEDDPVAGGVPGAQGPDGALSSAPRRGGPSRPRSRRARRRPRRQRAGGFAGGGNGHDRDYRRTRQAAAPAEANLVVSGRAS